MTIDEGGPIWRLLAVILIDDRSTQVLFEIHGGDHPKNAHRLLPQACCGITQGHFRDFQILS